jgi:hypothetical protein
MSVAESSTPCSLAVPPPPLARRRCQSRALRACLRVLEPLHPLARHIWSLHRNCRADLHSSHASTTTQASPPSIQVRAWGREGRSWRPRWRNVTNLVILTSTRATSCPSSPRWEATMRACRRLPL